MKTNRLNQYLLLSLLGGASLFVTSCDSDDTAVTEPKGAYEKGVFITNEGNYGTPNSEVSYFSRDGETLIPELFNQVNDRPLGDGAQSTTFIGDKAYIAVNNSQKIEVVDAYTFTSTGVINGLKIPRYVAALNENKAYVTEYAGYDFLGYNGTGRVSVLNLQNNTVSDTISVGLLPEGLLVYNNKLYVANGGDNTISVINTTTDEVESTITVGESPRFLVLDTNNKIWVLRGSYGTPGALIKIDPANNHSLTTYNFPAGTSGAGQLTINGAKNQLYYSYNGQVYSMATSATALPTTPLINRNPYGLGVDPETNTVYLGVGDYSTNGWVVRYQNTGAVIDSFQVRISPNGFTFR